MKITDRRKIIESIDEGVLRKMHQESSQQGADYVYSMLHNALEWEVFEGKMSIEHADKLLKDMAHGIVKKVLKIDSKSVKLGIYPHSMLPIRQEARSARIRARL